MLQVLVGIRLRSVEDPERGGLALVEGLVAHLGGAMVIESAAGGGVGIRVRLPIRRTNARPRGRGHGWTAWKAVAGEQGLEP